MYLNCQSQFSLRYGTIAPQDLPKLAKAQGYFSLVLTDINNTCGFFDFYKSCLKEDLKPILGIEFRKEDHTPLYIAIAKNNAGLYEINHFLSEYLLKNAPLPSLPPAFENAYVIYRLPWGVPETLRDNEFIGIASYEVNKLFTSPWRKHINKLLALNSVVFADPEGYKTHKLLRAIDQNVLLDRLDQRFVAHASACFQSPNVLEKQYELYPELLQNTEQLMDSCHIRLNTEHNKNLQKFTFSKQDDINLLEKLAIEGMVYRYGTNNKEALSRVKKELKVIADLGFLTYFLITYDIVRYAQSKGYYHVGRGSGANSIVAYCLKITDVDPISLDLYFERFINPHRASPPDFDLDFSWDERDDIIDYIFKRYGSEHVALIATFTTFQSSSIIRELGKVYGLPKADIDQMLDEPDKSKHHALAPEIFTQGEKMVELPNHLGIHAGGMLITDEPICNYVGMQMMPKGFAIAHMDMHVAEENGFFKFDILSQRGLGHIKETLAHIRKNHQVSIDIHRVEEFKKDPNINLKLSQAQTIGCFYIESPAMRGLITKLRCEDFKTLVAASSIIRPGVAKSGMMREYIYRYHNPDKFEYIHPKFKEILSETNGVMVYQEDVIKVAHYFAGLDLGEADILRRTMSGKSRGKMVLERVRDKFFNNCKELGYSFEITYEVWRQIESFSGYSFCKAHSASYAVESYQSLFLKTYYPLEFMVGVINNFGGFYNTELYVHEARVCGASIEAPCVNTSDYLTNISGKTICLGFVHLKSLEMNLVQTIVQERKEKGAYKNLEDFIKRTQIGKEQLCTLIRIDALRFTGKTKQQLLWEKNQFLLTSKKETPKSLSLFEQSDTEHYELPPLETEELEDIHDQIELLGFPLRSPFDLLKTSFRGDILTKDMVAKIGETARMVGYFVAQKNLRTSKGQPMAFGTWVDVEGRFFDSVHFPNSLAMYPFRGTGCYLMKGKIVEDFGFPSLEVDKMAKLEWRELKEYKSSEIL